ncbi:MAG: hypothetical protein ACYDGO_06130 [Smithellaceae bacterium]
MLRKYQPGRPDFLINTDWGIPSDQISKEAAESRGLKIFHGRWVSKTEKKQLKDEQNAYFTIRIIGCLLILLALTVAINIWQISRGTFLSTFLIVLYGLVVVACGIGLIRFARFTRYFALLIFVSFLVLPFTPLLADEKGAPLLIVLGVLCIYYLLRRTARKIFWPDKESNPDDNNNKSSILRKGIYLVVIFVLLSVGYFVYEMSQAKHMAADACLRATKGMLLEDYLSIFLKNDFIVIRSAEYIILVPERGMGRNYCSVFHDGQRITGSKTGFND